MHLFLVTDPAESTGLISIAMEVWTYKFNWQVIAFLKDIVGFSDWQVDNSGHYSYKMWQFK
jgi:hypothetical protein